MSRPLKRKRETKYRWPEAAAKKGFTPANSKWVRGYKPPQRRPSLQVQTYSLYGNSTWNITKGGQVDLLTSYSRGSDEAQRHSSETMTYKCGLDLFFYLKPERLNSVWRAWNVAWLIYDAAPIGAMPTTKTIFGYPDELTDHPYTWKVAREGVHRFVIKRRWVFKLESNGIPNGTTFTTSGGGTPCQKSLYFSRFVKRLGCRTEWKNSVNGQIGDIKNGALYIAVAPGLGNAFDVVGTCRMYFKSTGNQ
ncbi:coat protein [North American maize-associated mastrevirus]|nr:coat protein [North American maize-associated mastrevirus]